MNALLRCAALLSITIPPVLAEKYVRAETFIGRDFYRGFTWEAIDDPTHGRVNYIDQPTARSLNLSHATYDSFVMRADSTTVLDPDGPGRNSMRIKSRRTYTNSVLVADIRHMPEGCATWPALWSVDEATWPVNGEIDIVEGVNDVSPNQMTLHTTPGCTMPAETEQTGTTVSTNCDTAVNFNQGCGVHTAGTNSYGPAFNANGGGWYAMERNDEEVNVWFWPRGSRPPRDIIHPGWVINPDHWGTPSGHFPSSSTCDLSSKLGAHNIIINLTFCGDWAGNVYSQDGCPGTCVDTVNNDPASFAKAYWDFASLRTYE